MKKTPVIFILGIFALLLSQIYWLSDLYKIHKAIYSSLINEQLGTSIKKELTIRRSYEFEDVQNPKFIIKAAEDMTPEEIASHKDDTIVLKAAEKKGIGNNLADLFLQSTQDHFMISNPIKLQVLDSIFRSQLKESKISTPFQLVLYNKQKVITDSTTCDINKNNCIQTSLYPIGTQGLLFVGARVEVPPSQIFRHMLYALIVSFLMTLIICYCLYYQLSVIHKKKKALRQQKMTIHSTIHDLKAPLNVTYTILDSIAQIEKKKTIKQTLQIGKTHIRMLTGTIESMLDVIKKRDNSAIPKTNVDLPELIGKITQEMESIYPAKKYHFKTNYRLSETSIQTDKVRLERCLRNLIDNALKYSDDNVLLTFSLYKNDNKVTIGIKDNGWGIPLKEQKKIGSHFFRVAHAGKESRRGYGIGLCSVKLLVQEMNGDFTFQSEEGKGSTFFITLPDE